MDGPPQVRDSARPVEETLRRVVLLFRALAAAWMVVLVTVEFVNGRSSDRVMLAGATVLGLTWAGFTFRAARTGVMGRPWFVAGDFVVISLLSVAGLAAGAADFVSGGYPGSWLFVVAYATDLEWVLGAAVVLSAEHFAIHVAMGLDWIRTAGVFQFVVLGAVAGWAFDALREREALRVASEEGLLREQRASARLEAGTRIARQLHDSVLQTLKAIRSSASDPNEVRYLSRWQERELRRTIAQLGTEHEDGFRVQMMDVCDDVEDLFRTVEVNAVVRSDAAMTSELAIVLAAVREALANAAAHSGAAHVDLYAEIVDGVAAATVRDRGSGFVVDAWERGMLTSLRNPVEAAGGTVEITSALGAGTEVVIQVPLS